MTSILTNKNKKIHFGEFKVIISDIIELRNKRIPPNEVKDPKSAK